jgi:transcriptional regulator with XRE-family HTH domain
MAKPSPQYAGDPMLQGIGSAIRELRMAKGVSQESLANGAELDRSYMGGIERGEHNLTVMNLKKIADQLEISVSKLLKTAGF